MELLGEEGVCLLADDGDDCGGDDCGGDDGGDGDGD